MPSSPFFVDSVLLRKKNHTPTPISTAAIAAMIIIFFFPPGFFGPFGALPAGGTAFGSTYAPGWAALYAGAADCAGCWYVAVCCAGC